MKIPKNPVEAQQLYEELTRQCLASRNDRFAFYQSLRNYYLFGSAGAQGAPYNKVFSTIDTLCSFIYSPDAVRFSIHLGETAVYEDIFKSVPLAREVTDQWRTSGTHTRFRLGLRWSFVFGCMIMKVQWSHRQVRTFLVEPHQFGVLREDVTELADQEAFCMCYTITRTQLDSQLIGNPRREDIMRRVGGADRTQGAPAFSDGLNRLIIGSAVGGVTGSLAPAGGANYVEGGMVGRGSVNYSYTPKVESPLVDMCDLYVWNDDIEDYQLVSMATPNVCIYDRPQSRVGVKGLPHFVVIRPEDNLYDYFWGDSFTARLAWLQDWRTKRTFQIDKLQEKQVDPPAAATGFGGLTEEKFATMRSAGGRISSPMPGAKYEQFPPSVPEDLYASLTQMDAMFDDTAGIGHVLQGKGEAGVRSRGQADLMARLGSARPKERAIAAEESAENIASLILRNVQEHSEQRFVAEIPAKPPTHPGEVGTPGQDLPFIAKQFTLDYEVKVDAHSSSPIFIEDRKKDAHDLFEAHAIDRETLLEMYDPPGVQRLKEKLRLIEEREARAQQAALISGQQPEPHAGHHGRSRK